MEAKRFLSASEAAIALGINVSTLYSYVSRGLLRSEFADPSKRTRRYLAEDILRLKERQEVRRNPNQVVATALHWGTPMLDSGLTLIEGGHCYYRGEHVLDLAVHCSIEQVAAWLWTGEAQQSAALFSQENAAWPPYCEQILPLLKAVTPVERCQALLPLLARGDLAAYDFRPDQVAQTGARILRHMTLLILNKPTMTEGMSIATTLQQTLVPDQPQAVSLFSAALILCADHELNVSSFTARCVASAGSSPYEVVSAGLAALKGVKHGGNCHRVEALFREAATPEKAQMTLAGRIRRGESLPGFGHPLYPEGDPRGRLLLALVAAAYPRSPEVRLAMELAKEAQTALKEQPNIDFGLVTLGAALGLSPDSVLALFALGRTIGWIGHAIEAYQVDSLIRPRARYTGPLPESTKPAE